MSDVIAFLWNLMHDDEAKSQFDQDPHAALDDCGLSGVTARDIQDAQMMMQDSGLAHPRAGEPASGGQSDPVDEIRHTSTTYEIDRSMTIDNNQVFTVVDIDETTVSDSFNSGDSTTEVTAIQDNDTTTNNLDVTNVEDSFNDDSAQQDSADDTDTADDAAADSDADATADPDADAAADPDADTATDPDADATADPDADTATDPDADTATDPDADAADPYADTTADPDAEYHTLPAPDTDPVAPDAEVVDCSSEELDAPVG